MSPELPWITHWFSWWIKTNFGGVAVVEGVFYHQTFQHVDGYLTDLPELLQSGADFPEQESHQEVVLAEVICQWVIQLEVWEEEDNNEKINNTM